MTDNSENKSLNQVPGTRGLSALQQVSSLVNSLFPGQLSFSAANTKFAIPDVTTGNGHFVVYGGLDGRKIKLQFRLLSLAREQMLYGAIMLEIMEMHKEFTVIPAPVPVVEDRGEMWVALEGAAEPMGPSQEKAFMTRVETLKKKGLALQDELFVQDKKDPASQYKELADDLQPVAPWEWKDPALMELWQWAVTCMDFLQGNSCLALVGTDPVTTRAALSMVARVATQFASSLGELKGAQYNVEKLLTLAGKAPGIVIVPAIRLAAGNNIYDFANEVQGMLAALANLNRAVIFSGSLRELQGVFHGGQGGSADPLQPIVRHVPRIDLDWLVRFAVREQAILQGKIRVGVEQDIRVRVMAVLEGLSAARGRQLLPQVAARCVAEHQQKTNSLLPPLLSQSSPVTRTLRKILYPNSEEIPQDKPLCTSGAIDPGRLALAPMADTVFKRRPIKHINNKRGKPVLLIACDASGSLSRDEMNMTKLLACSWMNATMGSGVELLAGIYHSGSVRQGVNGPLVQWLFHPRKTPATSRLEATRALVSLPESGTGCQSDALSMGFMIDEARSLARGRMIYLILISDCAWNKSFSTELSGEEEMQQCLAGLKNEMGSKLDTTLVALGETDNTGLEEETNRIIGVTAEELDNPSQVAANIGGHVATIMRSRKHLLRDIS